MIQIRELLASMLNPERMTLGVHAKWYQPRNVELVVDNTLKMQALATEREIRFHVLIIPSLSETKRKRYSRLTRVYIDALQKTGIPVIEIITESDTDDYFALDGHWNSNGTALAAQALLSALKIE